MRSTATIRVDLVADTPEAQEFLLKTICREVNNPHRTAFTRDAKGTVVAARVERAMITRVRGRKR